MGLGLIVRGTSRRLPRDAAAALELIGEWAQEQCAGTLRAARLGRDSRETPYLALSFHPAAEPVQLRCPARGLLEASAKTSTVGPGYHRYVCAMLHLLSHEFDVAWAPPDPEGQFGDETGYFRTGDWEELQRQMLDWLGAVARLLAQTEGRQVRLNLPVSVGFAFEGPILTPLGPRSLEWRRAAEADPQNGKDIFPWWNALQDASYRLGLAQCLMWMEVRWRPPLDDGEEELLAEVDRHLQRAFEEDSSLAYPWREWQELLRHLGADSPHLGTIVRAAELAPETPKIGYRRGDVEFFLPGGWSVQAPGRFADGWDEELGAWAARDIGRSMHISTYVFESEDGKPASPERLLDSAHPDEPADEAAETFAWEEGQRQGRATLRRKDEEIDGEQQGGPWVLAAATAAPGKLAICTITFSDKNDQEWALAVWRSLKLHDGSVAEMPPPSEETGEGEP